MSYLDIINKTLNEERERVIAVSDRIWEFAEVRYEEKQSASLMAQTLEDAGFQVTGAVSKRRLSPPMAQANRLSRFWQNMMRCRPCVRRLI